MIEEADNCFVCAKLFEGVERFARVHSKDGNAEIYLCMGCFEKWRGFGLVDYVTITRAVDRVLVNRSVS
jgi:hypothetical protein